MLTHTHPDFTKIFLSWQELTVLRESFSDPTSALALDLARELGAEEGDRARLAPLHRDLTLRLVEWAELTPGVLQGDAWQQYLVGRLLEGENLFGRKASSSPLEGIGASLQEMVRSDLARLQQIYQFTSQGIKSRLQDWGLEQIASWDNGVDLGPAKFSDPLEARFHSGVPWESLLEELAAYHYRHGAGPLAHCLAFRWDPQQGLVPIWKPDPVTLEDLVGYDFQKAALIANTEQFLAGFPSNNILLYGARGTGKSSLVKALLNAYAGRGLRLVEVAREEMRHFPEIVRLLRGRPQRFLLYADDLSYDDSELNYRELKAALEGSLEGRPENVLLYATSNRRHLIKERFRDRETSDDEIHTHDTAQEKLSLADRFGLTLSFAPPTQAEYLRMVEVIAARRGLAIDESELRTAALRWAALHNTPSGRTARQFVDDLQGARMRAAVSANA